MGASFRSVGEVTELAGCDYLTIAVRLCLLSFPISFSFIDSYNYSLLSSRSFTTPRRRYLRSLTPATQRASTSPSSSTSTTSPSTASTSTRTRWLLRSSVTVSRRSRLLPTSSRTLSSRRCSRRWLVSRRNERIWEV